MKKLLLLASVLAWVSGVFAEEKPKLIVGVVISHFYPEWMDMYANELSENGLKRIMKQGARVNMNYNYFTRKLGWITRRFTRVCYPRNMGSCRGRGTIVYAGNVSILLDPIVIRKSVINRRIV